MKSRLIIFLILLCPLAAFAQVSDEIDAYLREFPQRAAFNAHSYEFLPLKDTPPHPGHTMTGMKSNPTWKAEAAKR